MSNIGSPVIKVYWKNLCSAGGEPRPFYRRECPFCESGMLLVGRDQETYRLEAHDRCIGCGQLVEYLDIDDMNAEEIYALER